ncbi:NUDIX domain-containing protein [soil metagenome]
MPASSNDSPGAEHGARAPRRPTADPRRFLVPAENLPTGFASRLDDPAFVPVATRPASTVVLARQGGDGVEVLLLRRPLRSGFAGGAWVFPGGRVDTADGDPELTRSLLGESSHDWAGRLGLTDRAEALGYVIAALREAWEETGILLGEASRAEALETTRRSLLSDEIGMPEAVRAAGIRFHVDDLLYIAHWITPEPEARRYDTRFFLARVPDGVECVLEGDELVEARWLPPATAVSEFMEGEMILLPPTVDTLRRLASFSDLDEAWSELGRAEVPAILPRMRREHGGIVIEY